MKTLITGVLAGFLVAPATALADQQPAIGGEDDVVRVATLDEMRRELKPGDVISVVQTTGDVVTGRLLRFDTDLEIQTETRQPGQPRRLELSIPSSAIQSLDRPRDSSRNGMLIGTGVGGGFALAMFVHAAVVDFNEIDEWAAEYVAIGGLCSGIGALTGWAVDAARSKPHVRFDASSVAKTKIQVVPLVSRAPGLSLVVSF